MKKLGRWASLSVVAIMVLGLLAACNTVQGSIQARNNALGDGGNNNSASNFAEARQINDIETWKDDPGKIVLLYINFPPQSDNILVVQCKGVPASSTESLEPNHGVPWGASTSSVWKVPVDGVDVGTDELAGRDGTFGDPVEYRQCLTVEGNYIDFPNIGVPYLTSSVPYGFKPSTVKRDFESEARLLQAEQTIRRGGCVNNETLQEQPCPKQEPRPTIAPDTQPTDTPGDTNP